MKTAIVLVGFTEGNWHARRFERELTHRGIGIAPDVETADYIIAHSGGCYVIPPLRDSQTLMLINPTYWPGRSLFRRSLTMIVQLITSVRPGNRPWYHLWKTAHNTFYLVYRARFNLLMIRQSKFYNLEQSVQHDHMILVRNEADPWLTPDLRTVEAQHPKLRVARLPGEHDDCWLNPEPYIRLLEEYR